MKKSENVLIQGTVSEGFESVQSLFERHMLTCKEDQVQLCVYHHGARVVDLIGSQTSNPNFTADSLINVFSSGKSLESIVLAYLCGHGLVDFNKEIAFYWPEFGQLGKQSITVADLMRHESGLENLSTPLNIESLYTDNIKQNSVSSVIEKEVISTSNKNPQNRVYHAFSRGWIANEVIRRVDPKKRTIGELLTEEFSDLLEADVYIGLNNNQLAKTVQVQALSLVYQIGQSFLPKQWGRTTPNSFLSILKLIYSLMSGKGPKKKITRPFFETGALDYFNHPKFLRGETSSANAACSARGLAKIASMMSLHGKENGKRLISKDAWASMHAAPKKAFFSRTKSYTYFTQGGVEPFSHRTEYDTSLERKLNAGREGFYGWMGFGGSIFQWHPGMAIGFAFAPSLLHTADILNERGKVFQTEVLKCAQLLAVSNNTR